MPVLLRCRVCKKELITADGLLIDVCPGCADKARRFLTESWEENRRLNESGNEGSQIGVRIQTSNAVDSKRPNEETNRRANGTDGGTKPGTFRLGEAIKAVTGVLGIPECGSCAKRRVAMNNIKWDAPAREVFKGLAESILNPEKVIENEQASDFEAKARGPK